MTAQKSRRRNYFIKKKFQADFFVKFAWLILTEALLIGALFMAVTRGTLTASYRGADLTIQRTGQYFFPEMAAILLLVGAAVAVLGMIILMFLSHRIGGAVYRFEKTLEEARNGDFAQRVSLRRTDELHDLNGRMNLFLETLDLRFSELKRETDKGLSETKDARAAEALRRIRTALERFKTSQ